MKLVILCGGSGTRLWPISRTSSPKQFAKLFDHKSLFELTIERNAPLVSGFIIVVNEKQLSLCKEQIPKELLEKTQFIIEPSPRNTAPAITLAALCAKGEEILVVASDHLIKEQEKYEQCIQEAQNLTKKDKLVTFGLKPQYPETGYGYIEFEENNVLSFKEKPSLETAKKYLESGQFLWNSGMFYFKSDTYLSELKKSNEEIYLQSVHAFKKAKTENQTYSIHLEDMMAIPKDSIDYAVMEKSDSIAVVPSHFYWTDLGSFDSLDSILEKDRHDNTQNDHYIGLNSERNLIIGDRRVIATFDINDLIIVDTEDALLIGKKGESQKVKELLEKVKEKKPELLD